MIACYIPMLEGQANEVRRWLDGVHDRYGIIPVMLPQVDWNDDLTPWPAEPIFKKGKSFGGKADACLDRLRLEIVPGMEADMGIEPEERWLVGVSLAGLFAVWATTKTSLFTRIASISGSFWYPGFADWLQGQTIYANSVYISLGDKEADSKNKHLKSIALDTESVVKTLESKGVQTTFEWTEGTHFGPVIPRMERALATLVRSAGIIV